jgi:uncharacterized delta-60 repeat protein
MDIRFTLQPRYAGSQYIAGPFNLSGTTDANITYELATNVPKSSLLTGHTVTTPYNITGGTIGSLGVCLNTENYVLTFSPGPIVIGSFASYSGLSKNGIVKTDNSGTPDNTFNVGEGFTMAVGLNGGPLSIVRQSDGKIFVGGNFTAYNDNGATYPGIIRLNPDGSKDYTFTANTNALSGKLVLAVAAQTDGKVIVGGCVGGSPTGATAGFLYRFNNNGTVDNSFLAFGTLGGNPTNLNGSVNQILMLPGGEIFIAGGFNNAVAKLNFSGAASSSFSIATNMSNPSTKLGSISNVFLDSANRIYLSGNFNNIGGTTRGGLARISTGGNLDAGWNPNPWPAWEVTSVGEDNNNNIYLAGYYQKINGNSGTTKNGLARLTPLGVLDPTFSGSVSAFTFNFTWGVSTPPSMSEIWFRGPKIKKLSDGNMLVAGPMLTYNTVPTLGFVKISSIDGALIPSNFTNSGVGPTSANYAAMICI